MTTTAYVILGCAVALLAVLGRLWAFLKAIVAIVELVPNIKSLMEIVHERSAELAAGSGFSMRDHVQATDERTARVESRLEDHEKRIVALETERRRHGNRRSTE